MPLVEPVEVSALAPRLADAPAWGGEPWRQAVRGGESIGIGWTIAWNTLDLAATTTSRIWETRPPGGYCGWGCGLPALFHVGASPLFLVGPTVDLLGALAPRRLLALPPVSALGLAALGCEMGGVAALFEMYGADRPGADGAFGVGWTLELSAVAFQVLELEHERRLARKTWPRPG